MMTDPFLDKHFPRATQEQRAAIKMYHGAGWTIEPMVPNCDQVAISQPAQPSGLNFAWINTNGRVVSI